MGKILHVTSGDIAGASLAKSGVPGEVFVWHDILYDGPRQPGWPDQAVLEARAAFLEGTTGGGLNRRYVLTTLREQYAKLARAADYNRLVLWFDACLFDQAMLCHILALLPETERARAELLCVDAFPGIEPYHGLGQLGPEQMAGVYGQRRPVAEEQFAFAGQVDRAFARQEQAAFKELAALSEAPLPWVPAAVARWLAERPDPASGLGRLEELALAAVRDGCRAPAEIFRQVAARETPPQYWGDVTLWQKINGLADREPPLVRIEGPRTRLPQWGGIADLKLFRVFPD